MYVSITFVRHTISFNKESNFQIARIKKKYRLKFKQANINTYINAYVYKVNMN